LLSIKRNENCLGLVTYVKFNQLNPAKFVAYVKTHCDKDKKLCCVNAPFKAELLCDVDESSGPERDSADVHRAVGVEIPIFRVVSRDLNEAVCALSEYVVGASLVVQLHLDRIVGPADGQVVVFAVVDLWVKVRCF